MNEENTCYKEKSIVDQLNLKFSPSVCELRYQIVFDILRQFDITDWCDLGCAEGSLLETCSRLENLERLIGVDLDASCCESSVEKLDCTAKHPLTNRMNPLTAKIYNGSALEPLNFSSFDFPEHISSSKFGNKDTKKKKFLVSAVELIEHLPVCDALCLIPSVLHADRWHPDIFILSSPNSEFNAWFNLPFGYMRHYDHKFEWTCIEFQFICLAAARLYDYKVYFMQCGLYDKDIRSTVTPKNDEKTIDSKMKDGEKIDEKKIDEKEIDEKDHQVDPTCGCSKCMLVKSNFDDSLSLLKPLLRSFNIELNDEWIQLLHASNKYLYDMSYASQCKDKPTPLFKIYKDNHASDNNDQIQKKFELGNVETVSFASKIERENWNKYKACSQFAIFVKNDNHQENNHQENNYENDEINKMHEKLKNASLLPNLSNLFASKIDENDASKNRISFSQACKKEFPYKSNFDDNTKHWKLVRNIQWNYFDENKRISLVKVYLENIVYFYEAHASKIFLSHIYENALNESKSKIDAVLFQYCLIPLKWMFHASNFFQMCCDSKYELFLEMIKSKKLFSDLFSFVTVPSKQLTSNTLSSKTDQCIFSFDYIPDGNNQKLHEYHADFLHDNNHAGHAYAFVDFNFLNNQYLNYVSSYSVSMSCHASKMHDDDHAKQSYELIDAVLNSETDEIFCILNLKELSSKFDETFTYSSSCYDDLMSDSGSNFDAKDFDAIDNNESCTSSWNVSTGW